MPPSADLPSSASLRTNASRRLPPVYVLGALTIAVVAATLAAVGQGAYSIAPLDVLRIFADAMGIDAGPIDAQEAAVLQSIRLPRVTLGLLTGAGLAVSGALMQGLFRNPLADPTLIGVAAGGALAAAFVIVLGGTTLPGIAHVLGPWTLPLAAFVGALAVTMVVYRIGAAEGILSLPLVLLAGIALNALAIAGVGFLAQVASDGQLRTLTFWNFGSLAGASWSLLSAVAPLVLFATAIGMVLGRGLNALAMGEFHAAHVGVDVTRLKRLAIVATALAVGALVAAAGVIGFIGLVAPHMVRLACGPDHRIVLPGSALAGALLVVLADLVARTIVAPAELPIGVLTSALGAPFFLVLLMRRRWNGTL